MVEQQRRAEAAQQSAAPQRQKAQEMKTPPLPRTPAVPAALAVVFIALVIWSALSKRGGDGQAAKEQEIPAVTTPSPATSSTPTATSAPVEILRYEQRFDGARFKLRFNARERGYLYLIAPDEKDPKKALTVFLPGQLLRPGVYFDFPAGNNRIEAGSGLVSIKLAFSPTPLQQFSVARSRPSGDTLQELQRQSDAQRAPRKQADGRGQMISAQAVPGVPLLMEIEIGKR